MRPKLRLFPALNLKKNNHEVEEPCSNHEHRHGELPLHTGQESLVQLVKENRACTPMTQLPQNPISCSFLTIVRMNWLSNSTRQTIFLSIIGSKLYDDHCLVDWLVDWLVSLVILRTVERSQFGPPIQTAQGCRKKFQQTIKFVLEIEYFCCPNLTQYIQIPTKAVKNLYDI